MVVFESSTRIWKTVRVGIRFSTEMFPLTGKGRGEDANEIRTREGKNELPTTNY